MADEVGNLKVTTEVDTSGIEDGLDKAEKAAAEGGEATAEALTKNLEDGLAGTEKAAADAGEAAGTGFSEKFSAGLAGVTAALGALLVSIGASSIDIASQSNESLRSIQTQLGLTEEDAAALRDAALDVYANGFGGSLEETTAALIEVRKQVKGLSDDELAGLTEDAFKLRDVFGVEVNESMNAVNTLMEQFGLTSEQATDFLTTGFQNGLNNSDDFLDTIGEYGPQFAASGFSAEEFFSTLETGQAGGVLGTDKIADAFKEFRLIVTEGSDETAAAFSDLGIDADNLYAGMQDGSLTTSDAFQMVQASLNGISDPIERNRLGVALFGTMWEDATEGVILGVDTAKTSLDDLAGATDGLNAKYTSFGSLATAAWRTFQTGALLPIGDSLLSLANTILPYVADGITAIGQVLSGDVSLSNFIENVGSWITGVIPAIETGLALVMSSLTSWVAANVPAWIQALGQFAAAAVSWVLDALPGLITTLGELYTGMITWVLDTLPQWGAALLQLGEQLWKWIVDALPVMGTQLGNVLTSILTWIGSAVTAVVPRLFELATAFVGWILTDVLPALPGLLGEILLTLGTFLGNVLIEVLPKLAELGAAFLNWVTDVVLPAIGGKLGEIWDAISNWIGNTAKLAMDKAGEIGTALMNGISDKISAAAGSVTKAVKAVINPVIGWLNDVIRGANSVAAALGLGQIAEIPQLAGGTQNWGGGLAMVSEPWAGLEWADLPGIGAGLLMPGIYDLPQGSQVFDAATTAGMLQPAAAAAPTVIQNFDAGITEAGVKAIALQAVKQALAATGVSAIIQQQTKRY